MNRYEIFVTLSLLIYGCNSVIYSCSKILKLITEAITKRVGKSFQSI